MPTLKNTNPLGDVDIDGVGSVKAGAEFEVSDGTAGAAPSWRKPLKDEDASTLHIRGEGKDVEVLDLGSGLLSQAGNFELVTQKKG